MEKFLKTVSVEAKLAANGNGYNRIGFQMGADGYLSGDTIRFRNFYGESTIDGKVIPAHPLSGTVPLGAKILGGSIKTFRTTPMFQFDTDGKQLNTKPAEQITVVLMDEDGNGVSYAAKQIRDNKQVDGSQAGVYPEGEEMPVFAGAKEVRKAKVIAPPVEGSTEPAETK